MAPSLEVSNVVPAAGFEPARPAEDFGFKDRCVYHSAMRAPILLELDSSNSQCLIHGRDIAENVEEIVDKQDRLPPEGVDRAQASQADKFRAAARRIGCDEDEARWTERLKKVVKVKPGKA